MMKKMLGNFIVLCILCSMCYAEETFYIYAGSQKIGKVEDGNVYYYVNDHLGSPRLIRNESGATVWSSDYRPFGKASNEEGETKTFTGKEYDSDTGLYYYGARYYDPIIGRFISPDPSRQFASPYLYCGNNPVNVVDPSGRQTEDPGFKSWLMNYDPITYRNIYGSAGSGESLSGLAHQRVQQLYTQYLEASSLPSVEEFQDAMVSYLKSVGNRVRNLFNPSSNSSSLDEVAKIAPLSMLSIKQDNTQGSVPSELKLVFACALGARSELSAQRFKKFVRSEYPNIKFEVTYIGVSPTNFYDDRDSITVLQDAEAVVVIGPEVYQTYFDPINHKGWFDNICNAARGKVVHVSESGYALEGQVNFERIVDKIRRKFNMDEK